MKFDIAYILCGAAVLFGLYWDVFAWPRMERRPATNPFTISSEVGTSHADAPNSQSIVPEAEDAEFVHMIGQDELSTGRPPLVTQTESDQPAGELADLWQTANGQSAENDRL